MYRAGAALVLTLAMVGWETETHAQSAREVPAPAPAASQQSPKAPSDGAESAPSAATALTEARQRRASMLYDRGTAALERSDFDVAALAYAHADELKPHDSALEAALMAVLRTDERALALELAQRTERNASNPRLLELAAMVRGKFTPAAAAPSLASAPHPETNPAPPEAPDVAASQTPPGWPPSIFWAGLGLTSAATAATLISLVDTHLIHADFENAPTEPLASEGRLAQTRTRTLGGVTAGLALVTLLVGVAAVDWSDPTPQVSVAGGQPVLTFSF